MKRLVVTIPAKDEEKTLPRVIAELRVVIPSINYSVEILVLNDGSKDRTEEICKELNVTCVTHKRCLGLAQTFRDEMKQCLIRGAEVILHMDADGQYDPKEIPKLLEKIEQGSDLVLGSRFLGTIEKMPLIKKIGNRMFSKVLSQITGFNISDGQTGFRAFTKEVAEIEIRSNHTYTQEQIIRAASMNFEIVEVPITFRKREDGTSRLMRGPFEYATKATINILRTYRDFRPLQFFGVAGFLFMVPGFMLALWFVYLNFTSGISGHMFAMMLMVLFFLAGLQVTLFGFLADKG